MTASLFSAGQAAAILFGVFAFLLVLRVPVAFALGLACLPLFYLEPRLGTMMSSAPKARMVCSFSWANASEVTALKA